MTSESTRRPTILDIARKAKVSSWTVSHVLNETADVSIAQATRARVMAVSEEIGYQPNRAARALATGKTNMVAFLAPDCFTAYYCQVGRFISQQSMKHNYNVIAHSMIMFMDDHNLSFPLPSLQVDGILSFDTHHESHLLSSLNMASIPLVSLGVFHEPKTDFVGADLYTGSLEAVKHLLNPGCRRVAQMLNEDSIRRDDRARAYFDVMQEAGLKPETIVIPNQERSVARKAIVDYAADKGIPEAIFCINDDVAIGCYRGLRDMGVKIPDDVAIVGCDGIPDIYYLDTPISTIIHPTEMMCERAWDFLEKRLQEPGAPVQQSVLPVTLLIQGSSLR